MKIKIKLFSILILAVILLIELNSNHFHLTVFGANGLVAAYNFNSLNNNSFTDLSGNNHTGSTNNGVSISSNGKFGSALLFNGTNGMATIPDSTDLQLTNTMTLEAWINPTTLNGWNTILLKEYPSFQSYSIYANTDSNKPSTEINTSGTSGDTRGTAQIPLNSWTHIASTYNGTTLVLYINGNLVSQKTLTGNIKQSANALQIGGNTIWGEFFKGSIDDVRIYNRVLTQSEIQIDMNTEVGTTPSPTATPSILPSANPSPSPSSTPDPRAQTGEWGTLMNWPIVAVHTVLMPNGKVLAWDGWEIPSQTRVWDPSNNSFSQITVDSGLFCSAHSHLADGTLLTAGGWQQNGDGIVDTNRFNSANNSWTRVADMSEKRWYPTTTTLSDGKVLVLSGMPTDNTWAENPEVYNPKNNTWTKLTGIDTSDTHDLEYLYTYPKSDGSFYVVSPYTAKLHVLNLSNNTWNFAGISPIQYGSLVQYAPGKLLMTGGGQTYGNSAQGNSAVIDLNQPTPTWRSVSPMQYGRYQHNLVVLPDSSVLVIGGTDSVNLGGTTGVLKAELWNPQTESWKTLPSMANPRMYHSTALLMPDGRVLSAGGGQYGNVPNYQTAQYYSPPYLFKGPRPTITSLPTTMNYNSSITLSTPNASNISKVVFIGLASVTHTVDMDQKIIETTFNKNGNNLVVNTPTNAHIAQPGYYMVFILDGNGIPSVAPIIKLNELGATPLPSPTPSISPSPTPNISASVSPSPSPSSSIQPPTPIASYNFNETSGNQIIDRTGNNHPGTINGTVSFNTGGKFGGALSFNGSSNYVSINDSVDLHLSDTLTLEAWVKSSAITNWRTILLKEKTGGLNYALYANTSSNKPSIELDLGTAQTSELLGTTQITNNSWTHFASTYDGTTLKFYINGNLISQKLLIGSVQPSTGKLRIGGNTVWGEYFRGLIDEVRIYNKALTIEQIQNDMNTPI